MQLNIENLIGNEVGHACEYKHTILELEYSRTGVAIIFIKFRRLSPSGHVEMSLVVDDIQRVSHQLGVLVHEVLESLLHDHVLLFIDNTFNHLVHHVLMYGRQCLLVCRLLQVVSRRDLDLHLDPLVHWREMCGNKNRLVDVETE